VGRLNERAAAGSNKLAIEKHLRIVVVSVSVVTVIAVEGLFLFPLESGNKEKSLN